MSGRDLTRLLRPKSVAVVGGGAWAPAVIAECLKMGFCGPIWPVHPKAETVGGLQAFKSVDDLPGPPDATFIGVNRHATSDIVRALSRKGAGGAVCFASGFSEAAAEDAEASALEAGLLAAAGEMPILGPNCYGFINYLDGALLWPDQHGGERAETGVAIIAQSSNIALNLTMQKRGLPLAYVITVGNQSQTTLSELGEAVLTDDRVTALGLYIEGIGDLRRFEALAHTAKRLGKRVVAIKAGRSTEARQAALSHTASMAGGDAGADALMQRLGIARADDLPTFLETLKLLHIAGPLPSSAIATLSCSGGEASLAADTGLLAGVTFPPLNDKQTSRLRGALGPLVALANPLDYHTYIWRDVPAMTATFAAMTDPGLAMTMVIADFPREDRSSPAAWACITDALLAAKAETNAPLGLVATLPEALPETTARTLAKAGIVPFHGLPEALRAVRLASMAFAEDAQPICLPPPSSAASRMVSEAEAKADLATSGLDTPHSCRVARAELGKAAEGFTGPMVLKASGLAHKTEAGGVALNLSDAKAVVAAAQSMPGDAFLLEEMIGDTVAELLLSVVLDPAHGFVLTLGAGGTWAELLDDRVSALLPLAPGDLDRLIGGLRISPVLAGYRGQPGADLAQLKSAIRAVEAFVLANSERVDEIEINPLIVTPVRAVAADALYARKDPT